LIHWEYKQRWQNGQRAQRGEYQAAFPEHADALHDLKPRSNCPRCQQAIVLEETAQTVHCPACESDSPFSTVPSDSGTCGEEAPGLDLRGYELIERLGGGGMGDVYRACDPALGRDLAVKVMKTDIQRNPAAERRFLREARVTGSLQHPGIVPVYNLGRLADGRLHYTMRLVRGETFAAILKDKSGKPECWPVLLPVFEKVCQAVAYAHSHRVLHRDLKPSNVMLGRFGEVQVMDWGLAKLLTPEDGPSDEEVSADAGGTRIHTEDSDTPVKQTLMGREMGTPAYMSPEQALGEWDAVDERADVFALGAILCEILTGQPAYSGGDAMEALRKAKRGDRTEALARLDRCGADAPLTSLCRECLASDREGRPRDAETVVKRVAAYQAEVQERLRRAELERAAAQVKAREERKRWHWMIAAVLMLLAGIAVSTWQAVRATHAEKKAHENESKALDSEGRALAERDKKELALRKAETAAEAEREAKKQIEKANEVLASIFHDLNPRAEEKGGPNLREQLRRHVERAAAQLDSMVIGDPLTVARLQAILGESLRALGQARQAIELLSKVRTTREAQLGPDHPDTLRSMNNLALAYKDAGFLDKALPLYEQMLETTKAQFGPDHPNTLVATNNLARAYQDAGQLDKAVPLFEQTLERMRTKLGPDHLITLTAMNNLGTAYQNARQLDKALPLLEQTLERTKAKLGPDHPDTLKSMNNLAAAYLAASQLDKALPLLEQTLERTKVRLDPDHPQTLTIMGNLVAAYRAAGKLDRAERLQRELLVRQRKKSGPESVATATALSWLGSILTEQKKYAEAEPVLRECLTIREKKLPDDWVTFSTRSSLGGALLGQKKYAEAERLLIEGCEGMKQREVKIPPQGKARLTEALERLVRLYEAIDKKDEATKWRKELETRKAKDE
jgi:serine/threonine protein kinase